MTASTPLRGDADGASEGTSRVNQAEALQPISAADEVLDVLERLRQLAASSSSEQQFLNMAIRAVCNTLTVPLGKVLEVDSQGEFLLIRAGVGWREGVVGFARVPAKPTSQAGLTLALREPVMFDDLRGTRRFTDALILRSHGVVSSLSIALCTEDRIIGVLSVHSLHRRDFSSKESRFLTDAAAIIAEALSRRRYGAP
jgi:GAF domain-containing protein